MILLDTNVVLDSLIKRKLFYQEADIILNLAVEKKIECCISANSLADIFYFCSKEKNVPEARYMLNYLLENFEVAAIDGEDCKSAMKLPIADFEDALIVQCALKYKVEYIITRDIKLHTNGVVTAVSPEEFLNEMQGN
ncbi:MAG: PIN domain-containing protein [Ruminococcus sp.]|jgi:predicted nucleic acid-binding protein|nr:PIN domain-containing protein [Ruminococcus sp.]